jgi:hypothetical protein
VAGCVAQQGACQTFIHIILYIRDHVVCANMAISLYFLFRRGGSPASTCSRG